MNLCINSSTLPHAGFSLADSIDRITPLDFNYVDVLAHGNVHHYIIGLRLNSRLEERTLGHWDAGATSW